MVPEGAAESQRGFRSGFPSGGHVSFQCGATVAVGEFVEGEERARLGMMAPCSVKTQGKYFRRWLGRPSLRSQFVTLKTGVHRDLGSRI